MEQLLGYLAATITTASFIPQVLQVVRTKDTKSISLPMYIFFVIGLWLWLIYGILLGEWPIIIANFITIILASTILTYKVKEVRSSNKISRQ